ncbi:MAG: hypothetical protein K940chlam7_00178 [Chlamydiae bacterium]|nr:hypothetical protein [Chlamydiota bacterium]
MVEKLEDSDKETEEKEEKKEEPKTKFTETFEALKKNENIESMISYTKTHTTDTIAYVLIILGIVWMLFQPQWGGMLVGLVAGFYFSKEVVSLIKSFNEFVEEQGVARSLILGGVVIAFFLMNYGFFIGAAIMIGLKVMLKAE